MNPKPIVSKQCLALLLSFLASFATAALGAIASVSASSFYAQLMRPEWAPPGWLFGPVWTALYILMAVAAWLVWREKGWNGARAALLLFAAQLIANALWSWLFFAWHLGAWAFADIILLWGLIVATIVCFWRIQHPAGMLLLPYLLWVSFASVLCWTIWQLNPTLL